jgi:hypothetical protein
MTLNTVKTSEGKTLEFKHSENLHFSPPYTYFLRKMADLIDEGHGLAFTMWKDRTSGILWAEEDGKIVGIICYSRLAASEKLPYLYVHLYTLEDGYREKGIGSTLNMYFENIAKNLYCKAVRRSALMVDKLRADDLHKLGYTPIILNMLKEIT